MGKSILRSISITATQIRGFVIVRPLGPFVIRPFHFQFRKKMKFYFLYVLFINSSWFFVTKSPYCRKRTDILTTKLKIFTLFDIILLFPRFRMNEK